jgi:hypothetical protein
MRQMAEETAEGRLKRLRRTKDAAGREALLAELLTIDAIPIVDGALRHRRTMINAGDRDDLRAQVLVRLLRRLTGEGEAIQNFEHYVATVTYHVVDDYVRATNPAGAMMANRLRYLCRYDPRFAMWDVGGETVCGLAAWRGQAPRRLEQPPREVDATFFDSLGHPVAIRDLLARRSAGAVFEFTSEDSGFRQVETRQLLGRLRDEIGKLPVPQRIALLLSIRDGKAASVLPHLGTLEEIAAMIGWEPASLAQVWTELPLDDDRIGAMLRLTRQQVINLRKSARARLTRRMEQWS